MTFKSKTRGKPRVAQKPSPLNSAPTAEPAALSGKLGAMALLLRRAEGATIAQLIDATGWKEASVRGALAGALRKRGLQITSEKPENGLRTYCVRQPLRVQVSA